MSQYERMISGRLYSWKIKDEKREALSNKRNEFLDEFNQTSYGDFKKRGLTLIVTVFNENALNSTTFIKHCFTLYHYSSIKCFLSVSYILIF